MALVALLSLGAAAMSTASVLAARVFSALG
jgi:hypothetical protein